MSGEAEQPRAVSRGVRGWDVVGFGDCDVDIYARVPRLPRPGEKVAGQHLGLHPGGVVANFCSATARLGLRSALISCVGDDALGELATADLRSRNVDVSRVAVLSSVPTHLCFVQLDGSGDKALTIVETAAMNPDPAQVDDAVLDQTRHLHLAPFDLEGAIDVACRAQAAGVTVSVDLEPTSLTGPVDRVRDLLGLVDVALPNSYAITALFGGHVSVPEAAQRLLEFGPELVAVGQGAEGAVLAQSDERVSVPAFDVEVVDTTGAGDAFNAAVVFGWLNQMSLALLGTFASAAAAIALGAVGARGALARPEDIESFLADRVVA